MADTPSVTFTRTRLMRLHTHQCMRTGKRICAVDTLARITEKALDDMEELNNKKTNPTQIIKIRCLRLFISAYLQLPAPDLQHFLHRELYIFSHRNVPAAHNKMLAAVHRDQNLFCRALADRNGHLRG